MNKQEIDNLISSIKAEMTFELIKITNGAVAYEFEDKRENQSHAEHRSDIGVFTFKGSRLLGLKRVQDVNIGSFEIGLQEKVEIDIDNCERFVEKTVPIIRYACNSLWFGIHLTQVLNSCLKKALRTIQLSTDLREYIRKFLIGLENQNFLIDKLNSVQKRYDLVCLNRHIALQADERFNAEYMVKDTLERTMLIGFSHRLPWSMENKDDFDLIFTWTVVCGMESVTNSKSMSISKLEDNLGIFEEQLAADISP